MRGRKKPRSAGERAGLSGLLASDRLRPRHSQDWNAWKAWAKLEEVPTFAWPACCVSKPAPIFCESSLRRDAVSLRPLLVPEQYLRAEWGTRERVDQPFW